MDDEQATGRARRWRPWAHLALRARLVLTIVAIAIVALATTVAITYTSLQSYLDQRLTQELANIATVPGAISEYLRQPQPANGTAPTLGVPVGTYAALVVSSPSGLQTVRTLPETEGWDGAVPVVPRSLIRSVYPTTPGSGPASRVATVEGTRHTTYLVEAQPVVISGQLGSQTNGILVVAVPYTENDATLHNLLRLLLIVSAGILVVVAGAVWLVVRQGLRPLESMADTAGEIAAGDLSQRVEDTDERTEVGQLGHALNVMLSRIEQAFRAREESEMRLRRFVADASHELRTPLTSIRGYAELFDHGLAERPEDLRRAMRRIDSESTRMAALVDDLLLLARLDQGRPLVAEPVDLARVAADAVLDASVVDPSRPITALGTSPVFIIGDEQRLRQLVGNLVANAVAHTPPGTPIEVVVDDASHPVGRDLAPETAGPAAGDRVAISVVDHGEGIAPELAEHVFERFWRADPSRVRGHGGAGLGLSIVAAIAAAHRGTVALLETPGGGATFRVELPIRPPAGASSTLQATASGAVEREREPQAPATPAESVAPD